jgi:hypothetical protein
MRERSPMRRRIQRMPRSILNGLPRSVVPLEHLPYPWPVHVTPVQENGPPAPIVKPVRVGPEIHVEALAEHPSDGGADARQRSRKPMDQRSEKFGFRT